MTPLHIGAFAAKLRALPARRDFSVPVRRRLWEKLAAHGRHDIPLYTSLALFHARAKAAGQPRAMAYERLLRNRGEGMPLDAALSGLASPEEARIIAAGERGGDIGSGFALAAELLETKDAIRKATISALAYPCFLLLLSVALLLLISRQVVPQFAMVLPPEQWTGAAAILHEVTAFLRSGTGAVFGMALGLAAIAIPLSLPRLTGRVRKALDDFGPWGTYRVCIGSAWLFAVATMMRAGVPLRSILVDSLSDRDASPYLQERVRAILRQVDAGRNLGAALAECGMDFPSREAVDDIAAYGDLPDFETRLLSIARDRMSDDIRMIQWRMRRLNLALLVGVGIEAGLLLAAVSGLQSLIGG
ncbi:MAG: type II secretion system F family protein [Desulfovibrio sp.]|jgi:type II secretory pathway component PulF|nr:type II secretion system F family protein [Desulfovibrio sp.]